MRIFRERAVISRINGNAWYPIRLVTCNRVIITGYYNVEKKFPENCTHVYVYELYQKGYYQFYFVQKKRVSD